MCSERVVSSGPRLTPRLLWQTTAPYHRWTAAVIILSLVDTIFAGLGIGMVLPVFQALLSPDHQNPLLAQALPFLRDMTPDQRMAWLAGLTVAVFVVKALVATANVVVTKEFVNRLRVYWMDRIGQRYLLGPYAAIATRKQGELLNDWFSEPAAAARFLLSYLKYLSSLALVIALIVLGLIVDWRAMLALLGLGGLVMLLIQKRTFGAAAYLSERKLAMSQATTAAMAENISHCRELKLLGAETRRLEQLHQFTQALKHVFVRGAILGELPRVLGEFLAVVGIMGFVVFGVVVMKADPREILPVLAFFLVAFYRLITAASVMMGSRVKALNELHSVRLVSELSAEPTDREPQGDGTPLARLESDIRFEGVCFSYPDGEVVLRDLDLVLEKGRVTFLVGASGAGKSTLFDLILRLQVPDKGRILANGHDISQFDLSQWRRRFGYVSQEAALFNGSIRENLVLAAPRASDDDLETACHLAGAHGFILALPDGYDTMVGDRGFTLSGGQRKRIAIARALIGNPDVLLMDEATTSFEQSMERRMLSSLLDAKPGLSIVQITHRLQTASLADRVVVMEQGRIAASGTWQDVETEVRSLYRASGEV